MYEPRNTQDYPNLLALFDDPELDFLQYDNYF